MYREYVRAALQQKQKLMLTLRPAHSDDLPALLAIRYHDRPAIHRDRILAADLHHSLYLVAFTDEQLVGFGLVLFERPPEWTDTLERFPMLIDLFVAEEYRGRGIGQALIAQSEALARSQRKSALFLSVEPRENPRAFELYKRLDYRPLQVQPYHNVWRFVDSDGLLHSGEEWLIDMWKPLTTEVDLCTSKSGTSSAQSC